MKFNLLIAMTLLLIPIPISSMKRNRQKVIKQSSPKKRKQIDSCTVILPAEVICLIIDKVILARIDDAFLKQDFKFLKSEKKHNIRYYSKPNLEELVELCNNNVRDDMTGFKNNENDFFAYFNLPSTKMQAGEYFKTKFINALKKNNFENKHICNLVNFLTERIILIKESKKIPFALVEMVLKALSNWPTLKILDTHVNEWDESKLAESALEYRAWSLADFLLSEEAVTRLGTHFEKLFSYRILESMLLAPKSKDLINRLRLFNLESLADTFCVAVNIFN